MDELIKIGESKLSKFQKDVLQECLLKGSGGMSLQMGSGKTIISIVLGLIQSKTSGNPVLVVVSKSLIESWVLEIKKFFQESLSFVILHTDTLKGKDFENFSIDSSIKVVLTTPETVAKYYSHERIADSFIELTPFVNRNVKKYSCPKKPFLGGSCDRKGGSLIFSMNWGCLIVDEVQKFTKISSLRCQGISSIYSKHKWALSGTMFDEPDIERILGYHLIINYPKFPKSIPATKAFIGSTFFTGLNSTIVYRKSNPEFELPQVNQIIVTNQLEPRELALYLSMKTTMDSVKEKARTFSELGDKVEARRYSSYLLAILIYLRQSVVCPVLPIRKISKDIETGSCLSKILLEETEKLDLKDWINSPESSESSRIKKITGVVNKHKSECIVIFTCFRSCLNIIKTFMPSNRKIFTISSSDSIIKRGETIVNFKDSLTGILLLTYDIGAEGLNLQFSKTVLLTDFAWNDGKSQQAIARVLRRGQTADSVNVYLFTSNTGVEKAMFKKQSEKLLILEDLETGSSNNKITKMSIRDAISIISRSDNVEALEKLNKN